MERSTTMEHRVYRTAPSWRTCQGETRRDEAYINTHCRIVYVVVKDIERFLALTLITMMH